MMILLALSIVYILKSGRELFPGALTGYILCGYFTLVSIVFSGQSRFHFPMMPWVAMYAAWTITQWIEGRQPTDRAALVVIDS